MGFEGKIDMRRTARLISSVKTDPDVLEALGECWKNAFDEYIPGGPYGDLSLSAEVIVSNDRASVYYDCDYAHFAWVGLKYVDPWGYGGYYDRKGDRWFSKPGISKFITTEPLNFEEGEARWTVVATQNLAAEVREEMRDVLADFFEDNE